jgi:hypothetical protein
MEQLVHHSIRKALPALRFDDVDRPVGDEQIEPAIVVVVEPVGSEAGEHRRRS